MNLSHLNKGVRVKMIQLCTQKIKNTKIIGEVVQKEKNVLTGNKTGKEGRITEE